MLHYGHHIVPAGGGPGAGTGEGGEGGVHAPGRAEGGQARQGGQGGVRREGGSREEGHQHQLHHGSHPALIQLVLMLLASLHNAARDDTEVLLVHAALILALSP